MTVGQSGGGEPYHPPTDKVTLPVAAPLEG